MTLQLEHFLRVKRDLHDDPDRWTSLASPSTLQLAPDLTLTSLMLLPFFPIRAPTSVSGGIWTDRVAPLPDYLLMSAVAFVGALYGARVLRTNVMEALS